MKSNMTANQTQFLLQSIFCYIIKLLLLLLGITAINIPKQTGFNSCLVIYNNDYVGSENFELHGPVSTIFSISTIISYVWYLPLSIYFQCQQGQ